MPITTGSGTLRMDYLGVAFSPYYLRKRKQRERGERKRYRMRGRKRVIEEIDRDIHLTLVDR